MSPIHGTFMIVREPDGSASNYRLMGRPDSRATLVGLKLIYLWWRGMATFYLDFLWQSMPHLTLLGEMGNAFKPQRVPQVGQRFPSFPCLAVSLPPPCMASFKDISWSRFGEHSFVRPPVRLALLLRPGALIQRATC